MMKFRIGYGYDVHALGEGLPLILGGVEIEHAKGCIAHSDGDVVPVSYTHLTLPTSDLV